MAEHVVDTINYTDNGKVIRKDTWQDDNGQQWDTFTPVDGVDATALGNGTLVHPGEDIAQNAANQQQSEAVRTGMPNTGTSAYLPPQYVYAPSTPVGLPTVPGLPGTPYYTPPPAPTPVPTPPRAPGAVPMPTLSGPPGTPRPGYTMPTPSMGGMNETGIPPGLLSNLPGGLNRTGGGSGAYADQLQGASAMSVNPNNPLGAGAQSAVVQPPANPPSPGTAPSSGAATGNAALYNWDNPTQALVNSMRASGHAINTGNPIFQMLMRAAPGLAASFLMRGAQAGQQSTDNFGDFNQFLQNAVSQGNVPTILRQAQQSLPDIISQARAYRDADQSGSPNPLASNTLLGSLTTMLNQNNGSGVLDVLNNLNTPLMNRSSSSAYQGLLGGPAGLGSQANFNLGQAVSGGDDTKDFWYYLLGR